MIRAQSGAVFWVIRKFVFAFLFAAEMRSATLHSVESTRCAIPAAYALTTAA